MMTAVELLINQYGLLTHPEGGYYAETYRSELELPAIALPEGFSGPRQASTAIYFLLEQGNFSAFHRIKSDECWHFYTGDPLWIYILTLQGDLQKIVMGNHPEKGEKFQFVVPANCWFASEPAPGSVFSFTGCTVAPGFDFADFELASAKELQAAYPEHAPLIRRLCR